MINISDGKVTIHLPVDLKARLWERARGGRRSMSSIITIILERWLKEEEGK